MVSRTQISLDPELHRRAKAKAAALGISLAEYLRRLVAEDLEGLRPTRDPSAVFNLGDSGESDVARHKAEYVAQAIGSARRATSRRRARR
jgi:hypothetical protein